MYLSHTSNSFSNDDKLTISNHNTIKKPLSALVPLKRKQQSSIHSVNLFLAVKF